MKYRIAVLLAALCTVLGLTFSAAPAQARLDAGPLPIPQSLLTSYKFWPYAGARSGGVQVCVAVGDTVAPIGAMAQAWNNATFGLALDASNNCVTDGYSPSLRMTIDTYSAADGTCYKLTNVGGGFYASADSFRRWTSNPVGLVNRYYEGCWSTALLRQKWTAIVIGRLLGAAELHGSQYDGRGMSVTSAVYGPSANTDGQTVTDLYYPSYYGIY